MEDGKPETYVAPIPSLALQASFPRAHRSFVCRAQHPPSAKAPNPTSFCLKPTILLFPSSCHFPPPRDNNDNNFSSRLEPILLQALPPKPWENHFSICLSFLSRPPRPTTEATDAQPVPAG